jgi:hypothetical protein
MNQITFQDFEKVAMYVGTSISINEFDKAFEIDILYQNDKY